MLRWLRRWLGIDNLEERLSELEAHKPEGRWYIDDDPAKKRAAMPKPSDLGLAPGASGDLRPWLDRGPKDLDDQPDLRRREGPYL